MIVTWDGLTIPMVRTSSQPTAVCSSFQCSHSAQSVYTAEKARILDAKYDRTSAREVAQQCTHLSEHKQNKLYLLLNQFPNLFSGKLGRYVRRKFSIKLKNPSTQPIFCNPYPIPLVHQAVFKRELQHLIDEKVLKRIDRSEWAFPTFLIPKKDGRVRWISDFRKLNKLLRRPRYFLPSIPFIMQKRAGFTYVTKIDISMGFYTFQLDEEAQKLCVISTPFGLYAYLRLPMGLTNSPDVFQSVMHPLFQDILAVDVFIDDIGVFTNSSLEDHLTIVKKVLQRLEENGFTVNPLKCAWAVKSTDYLGFLITTDGLKPLPKKVEAISRVARPTSTKEVRSFVGLINYYKDMWPKRAHILAPLTELCSSKNKFKWLNHHENSFQMMKRLISEDVLLRFPNHSKPFYIYTDASNYQIGATIKQDNLPVAYFSKKLTPTQRRYSTIEQEMLAIVEVLKEYRNFLLGINGHKNVEADALSRLTMIPSNEGITVMMNHPPMDPHNPIMNKNPLDLKFIQSFQQRDNELQDALNKDPRITTIRIKDNSLITYKAPNTLKRTIIIPKALQYPTIRWLHSILGHAGINRLYNTMKSHFWFPNMIHSITKYVKQCQFCQRYNKQTQKYGHVPPKNVLHLNPWDEVCVDMIGPWKITINNFEYQFRALTCIDSIICLPEIIPVDSATSQTVAHAFEDAWLSRYPAPQRCLHDNGNEFLGPEFSAMLTKNNIKSVPTSIKKTSSKRHN